MEKTKEDAMLTEEAKKEITPYITEEILENIYYIVDL